MGKFNHLGVAAVGRPPHSGRSRCIGTHPKRLRAALRGLRLSAESRYGIAIRLGIQFDGAVP